MMWLRLAAQRGMIWKVSDNGRAPTLSNQNMGTIYSDAVFISPAAAPKQAINSCTAVMAHKASRERALVCPLEIS